MSVEQYNIVANDWVNLEFIINDLVGRVVGQEVHPTSSPTFGAGAITNNLTVGGDLDVTGDFEVDGTLILVDLTASRIVATDANKALVSLASPLIVTEGGTGAATLTDGGVLLGSGTGAITAMDVLLDGEFIVGNGTTDPVAESGNTARTSLGLGTGNSPTFTGLTLSAIGAEDSDVDKFLVDSTGVIKYRTGAQVLSDIGGQASGDYITALTGEVTATGPGSVVATIANDAVTYAKIQNVSATDKVLGRATAGAGNVEEIACTAAGRAILDDADASAQRTTLGLVIGTDVQAHGDVLDDLNTLGAAASDGQFIVATGAGAFAYESTTTARTSLGIGEGDSPTFAGVTITDELLIQNETVSMTAVYYALRNRHIKTLGASNYTDDFYGVHNLNKLNQSEGEIGNLIGVYNRAIISDGSIGAVGNTKSLRADYNFADLDGGVITGNAYGSYNVVDQESGNEVTGNVYGLYSQVDAGGTVGGTAYVAYFSALNNVDYGIYQAGATASNHFQGSITAKNYEATNKLTACATNAGALDFSAASKTLTVEDNTTVNQDYSSDASPTFAGLSLGTGELTCGSINRAADTLTLEINGTPQLSLSATVATFAGNLVIPDAGYIGSVSATSAMQIEANGKTVITTAEAGSLEVIGPIKPLVVTSTDADKSYVGFTNADGETAYFGLRSATEAFFQAPADGILKVEVSGGDLGPFAAESARIGANYGDTAAPTNGIIVEGGAKIGGTACWVAQQTATGDGTTTIDWGLGNKFYFTFGAQNDTFTFTAPGGPCDLILVLKQDGTGSRTVTWPNTVMWPGGTAPTLSTGVAAVDLISFYWDGTNYFGNSSLDYSVPA